MVYLFIAVCSIFIPGIIGVGHLTRYFNNL